MKCHHSICMFLILMFATLLTSAESKCDHGKNQNFSREVFNQGDSTYRD